jgi:hypothetical protein
MLQEFADTTVRIGVNPMMDPKQSHGMANYRRTDGKTGTVHFLVDHPRRLKHPTDDAINDVIKQLHLLGYPAVSVTVKTGKISKVFRPQ